MWTFLSSIPLWRTSPPEQVASKPLTRCSLMQSLHVYDFFCYWKWNEVAFFGPELMQVISLPRFLLIIAFITIYYYQYVQNFALVVGIACWFSCLPLYWLYPPPPPSEGGGGGAVVKCECEHAIITPGLFRGKRGGGSGGSCRMFSLS